jgi:hypothetical protein
MLPLCVSTAAWKLIPSDWIHIEGQAWHKQYLTKNLQTSPVFIEQVVSISEIRNAIKTYFPRF